MKQDNNSSINNQTTGKTAYKFLAAKKEVNEENIEPIETPIVEQKEPVRKKRNSSNVNYANTFLCRYELSSRQGLHLEIETISTIKRIIYSIGEDKLTVSGFVENVLKHHFEFYKDEVNRLYEEKGQKPIQ